MTQVPSVTRWPTPHSTVACTTQTSSDAWRPTRSLQRRSARSAAPFEGPPHRDADPGGPGGVTSVRCDERGHPFDAARAAATEGGAQGELHRPGRTRESDGVLPGKAVSRAHPSKSLTSSPSRPGGSFAFNATAVAGRRLRNTSGPRFHFVACPPQWRSTSATLSVMPGQQPVALSGAPESRLGARSVIRATLAWCLLTCGPRCAAARVPSVADYPGSAGAGRPSTP